MWQAVSAAAAHNRLDNVEVLSGYMGRGMRCTRTNQALVQAAEADSLDVVEYLLDTVDC